MNDLPLMAIFLPVVMTDLTLIVRMWCWWWSWWWYFVFGDDLLDLGGKNFALDGCRLDLDTENFALLGDDDDLMTLTMGMMVTWLGLGGRRLRIDVPDLVAEEEASSASTMLDRPLVCDGPPHLQQEMARETSAPWHWAHNLLASCSVYRIRPGVKYCRPTTLPTSCYSTCMTCISSSNPILLF